MDLTINQQVILAATVKFGPKEDKSICYLLDAPINSDVYAEFSWYSGNKLYPIEGSVEAFMRPGKWAGDRGRKRIEICKKLLQRSPAYGTTDFEACVELYGELYLGVTVDDIMSPKYNPSGREIGGIISRWRFTYGLYTDLCNSIKLEATDQEFN